MNKQLQEIVHKGLSVNEYKWLLVTVFAIVTLIVSWNSDDAYHAYVMARNLADGNGFVYNIGYRVSATTCPLFTLITALLYKVFGHMTFIGILEGLFFSTAAVYIVVFKFCRTVKQSTLAVSILLGCYCFMCYTTAGLENSLLYFLSALFLWIILKIDFFDAKHLFFLALILSLIAMTRMDAVLLFVPVICMVYLAKTKVKWLMRIAMGIAGLSPFFLWELFSIIYYGYPFPNTMYIKLSTDLNQTDYYKKGLDFIFQSGLLDILLIIVPLLFAALTIWKKGKKEVFILAGVVLYIFYVIYIGGDFMAGRHLTVPFFVSFLGLLWILKMHDENSLQIIGLKNLLLFLLILEMMWATCIRPIEKTYLYDVLGDQAKTDVADEKLNYYPYTGLIPYTVGLLRDNINWQVEFCKGEMNEIGEARNRGDVGHYAFSVCGMTAFYEQDNTPMYLTDGYGLMDPLLSHLPAIKHERWRVGHMVRKEPAGYARTVAEGENHIENPSLHEYYDKILLIISGDIWDKERLKTIVDMNAGKYDYLIEEYLAQE